MISSPLLSLPGAVAVGSAGSSAGSSAGTSAGSSAGTIEAAPGLVAWHYGDPFREQRAAARPGGMLVDGWTRGTVRVTGPERLRWLSDLASQDFLALPDASARPEALWLSHQGHVEHWAAIEVDDDAVLLETASIDAAAALAAFLRSRVFRAEVEIADVSGDVASLTVLGPAGARSERLARADVAARALELIAAGARPGGTWAVDALRIMARQPRIGVDTDARTLPNEAPYWMKHAVSLTKGCYCGQETVARISNVGAPPRRLALLNLDGSGGELPQPGDDVTLTDGAVVGRVGTVAHHWEDGPIALALVKRTVAPGVPLTAGAVAALIDPDDIVPPGPRKVDRGAFIDLRR